MYQSISSIEHIFVLFFHHTLLFINSTSLSFDLFKPYNHILKSSVNFHLVSEFMFLVLFPILSMQATVNKATLSLRKTLTTLVKSHVGVIVRV